MGLIAFTKMNEDLAIYFDGLVYARRKEGKESSATALANSAKIIRSTPYQITSAESIPQKTRGIGPKSRKYINDFFQQGPSLNDNNPGRIIALFTTVYGIGPERARQYYELGCRTLTDLTHMQLPSASFLYLRYYNDLQQRIPREEISFFEQNIRQIIPSSVVWAIAGSYRREEATSGDIDLLIRKDNFTINDFLAPIFQQNYLLRDALASGDQVFQGLLQVHPSCPVRRIDFKMVPPEEWATAILHFTGSVTFNTLIRAKCLELGYSLNEHGVTHLPTGQVFHPSSEEQIFEWLQIPYYPPAARTKALATL